MIQKIPISFSVVTGSSEPIYKQLLDQLKRMVASGQLSAGDDLPSVRELAQTLAVNPMTISKAWSLAEAAGILERRRGLGMVVASQHAAPQSMDERIALLLPAIHSAAKQAQQLEIGAETALALFEQALGERNE